MYTKRWMPCGINNLQFSKPSSVDELRKKTNVSNLNHVARLQPVRSSHPWSAKHVPFSYKFYATSCSFVFGSGSVLDRKEYFGWLMKFLLPAQRKGRKLLMVGEILLICYGFWQIDRLNTLFHLFLCKFNIE